MLTDLSFRTYISLSTICSLERWRQAQGLFSYLVDTKLFINKTILKVQMEELVFPVIRRPAASNGKRKGWAAWQQSPLGCSVWGMAASKYFVHLGPQLHIPCLHIFCLNFVPGPLKQVLFQMPKFL